MTLSSEDQGEVLTWEFYDSWEAFPLSRFHNTDPSVVGVINVGLSSSHGGTEGEFHIRFYSFSSDSPQRTCACLEAFGDAWKVVFASPLPDALAVLNKGSDGETMDDVKALLLSLGYVDRTERLKMRPPLTCPTCHGLGKLT